MGKGATFTVELPIVQEAFLRQEVEPHARKRILVIDDEEEVLRLIIRIPERMGHQVVALARGETTLDKMDKEEYDLIISDVRMPRMGGQELYQQIPKRLHACLPPERRNSLRDQALHDRGFGTGYRRGPKAREQKPIGPPS